MDNKEKDFKKINKDILEKYKEIISKQVAYKPLSAGMDEIVVSSSENPIIGTESLIICYGILLYDRKNKEGMVGHATVYNYQNIMREMVSIIRNSDKNYEDYEFLIIPGLKALKEDWDNIDTRLNEYFYCLGFEDYMGETEYLDSPDTHERSFMFDVKKGLFVSKETLQTDLHDMNYRSK